MFSIRRGRCGIKAIGSLIDGLANLRHLLRVAPYEETFRSGSERLGVNEIFIAVLTKVAVGAFLDHFFILFL